MDHPRVRTERQEPRPSSLKTPCSAPTASRGSGPEAPGMPALRLPAVVAARGSAPPGWAAPGTAAPGTKVAGGCKGAVWRVQGALGESGQGCRGAGAGPGARRDPGASSLSFFANPGALGVDRCERPLRVRGEVEINPSIGKSPLYKGGRWGRSSELGSGRQRKVVLGRVLGTVLLRAGWV